ncbi:MAG: glycosyltransferase [Pseudoxanthomonas sp.]
MPTVNVVAWDNGLGLSQDMRLIAAVLAEAGMEARMQSIGRGKLRKWFGPWLRRGGIALDRLRGLPRPDVNVMLEHVRPELFAGARRNVFIPNPEWCTPADVAMLPSVDRILVKTRHAETIFAGYGKPVAYVGFTSGDCLDAGVPRRRAFFHLAGRSTSKGTQQVFEAWLRHPEWPTLTVVQNPRVAKQAVRAGNIEHRIDYIDRAELRRLQNQHLFHLCPSQAEGFGHYIVEALSVGAVVLSTDAEPMNELVAADRGILLPATTMGPMGLSLRYRVDAAAIEAAVQAALAMEDAEVAARSRAAREFYLRNDAGFRQRLCREMAVAAA